jgi:membrane-bound lytic murein transglycosylase D
MAAKHLLILAILALTFTAPAHSDTSSADDASAISKDGDGASANSSGNDAGSSDATTGDAPDRSTDVVQPAPPPSSPPGRTASTLISPFTRQPARTPASPGTAQPIRASVSPPAGTPTAQPDAQSSPLPAIQATEADAPAEDDDNLWQRIKNGYAMPDLQSPFTAAHESWYAARPEYVRRMMGRSQKYLYHIVEEVQKRGMPTEIALLPMVESAFNPQAYSSGHASGIWQFVPATGKNFGLKQNWWVDNRRDVTAATDAALTYLQKLHVMFGTWDLALAAYNAGEGTVMRAIERNRKKGLPTDYQSLNLPPETMNYVPKLQAVKNIISNPEQYGLDIQPIANQPYFTQVSAPKQIDTKLAAKLAGVSLEEFVSLNPEYNRPVMTSTAGKNEILLPIGRENTFATNLANYNKPLVNWRTYDAKRGERIDSVARKFGVSVAELRDVNDIGTRARLKASRPLLVPIHGQSAETDLSSNSMAATPQADEKTARAATEKHHTVGRGDTVNSIAKRYGITTKQLLALNHLTSPRLKNGQSLLVQSPPAHPATKSAAHASPHANTSGRAGAAQYTVQHGDTLIGIAHKFDVPVDELKRWNKLASNRIAPGHKLVLQKPNGK